MTPLAWFIAASQSDIKPENISHQKIPYYMKIVRLIIFDQMNVFCRNSVQSKRDSSWTKIKVVFHIRPIM